MDASSGIGIFERSEKIPLHKRPFSLPLLIISYFLYYTIMNYTGLIIGAATFLIIGLFHPIVIKAEYHFGTKCWWVFALAGILFVAASLWVDSFIWSTLLGVIAFSSFWSILELFEQKKRVEKGWFPKKSAKR